MIETKKRTISTKSHLVCVEVKYSKKWERKWEKAMRSLSDSSKVKVEKMIGVYFGKDRLHFNGVDVLPVQVFLKQLYAGEIF